MHLSHNLVDRFQVDKEFGNLCEAYLGSVLDLYLHNHLE